LDFLFRSFKSNPDRGIDVDNEFELKERISYFGDNKSKPPHLNSFFFFVYK
jgi:hypothetical protein